MLRGVQVLRGAAAVGVILFHVRVWEGKNLGRGLSPAWFSIGEAGVDLFFVISGFIMVFIQPAAVESGRAWLRFIIHRFSRVFPPLWLVLTALVPLWLVRPGLFNNYCQNRVDVARSFLLLPQDQLPLLGVAWTLIHEVYFYLVVSLALTRGARGRWWVGLGWFAVVALGFTWFGDRFGSCRALQLVFSPFSLTFLLGYFLGLNRDRLRAAPPVACLAIGLIGLVIGCMVMPASGVYPDNNQWTRFVGWGVPCAFLVAGTVALESRLPEWVVKLQFLGDRSYALYLVHLPIVSGCYTAARGLGVESDLVKVVLMAGCLFGCLFAANLFHVLLELRATRMVRTGLEKLFFNGLARRLP